MTLDLIRVGQSSRGTFGVLRNGQFAFALTLERPWLNNEQNVSCIPTGRYRCRNIRSPRFGNTYEVCDVPGRTNVLFHAGNTIEDTQGCILVAEEFSGTSTKPMIVSSRRGFLEFMTLLNDAPEFELNVYQFVAPEQPVQV